MTHVSRWFALPFAALLIVIATGTLAQPRRVAADASLDIALNKTHEPNPTQAPWNLGVPIDYVITLKNVGGLGSSHIFVNDKLPEGFIVTKIQCDAPIDATCPSTPLMPPLLGEFAMKANDSNITLRISGYYKTTGLKENTATAIAKDDQGNAVFAGNQVSKTDKVDIQTTVLPVDLIIDKKVTPISTQFPEAKFHYEITVTNDSEVPIYLGGILWVRDVPKSNGAVSIDFNASNFKCSSTPETMCPDLYLDANQQPASVLGKVNSNALEFPFDRPGGLPTNDVGFMKSKGSFTIEYDLKLTTDKLCSNGDVEIWNEAFLDLANSTTHVTDNNGNNTKVTPKTKITGLPTTCPKPEPAPGTEKTQTPSSGPIWNGSPVTYTVKVTNTRSTAMDVTLADYLSKYDGTPPFIATLTSGPKCVTPGCTLQNVSTQVVSATSSYSQTTNYKEYLLWSAIVKQLPAGQSVVIEYSVAYAAVCETDKAADLIRNRATVSFPDHSSKSAYTYLYPDEAGTCTLWGISKTPKNPILDKFGDTIEYVVEFRNNAQETRTMGTVRDVASIISDSNYGTVPAAYEYSCDVPGAKVTNAPTTGKVTNASFNASSNGWVGTKIIDATNVTFEPGAILRCTVKITLNAPIGPACQGKGTPKFVNAALMDASPFYNPNSSSEPLFYASTEALLPLCRKALVSKIALFSPPAKSPEFGPGALVTYKITATNTGTDDLAGFTLKDVIQPPLIGVSVKPCTPLPTACSSPPALANNVVDVKYAPLKAGQGVTFELTVKAPQAGGSYPNTAKGSFLEGGKWYFQGSDKQLEETAHITVLTPKLAKSFAPAKIGPGGTSTLTFDITNTTSDPAQNGMSFTDTLPAGLVMTGTPLSTCGGAVSLSSDGRSLSLSNGSLPAGTHSCRITTTIAATGVCGIYRNDKTNFSNVANVDVSNVDERLEVGDCPIGLVVRKIVEGAPAGFQAQFNFNVKCTSAAGPFSKSFTIAYPAPGLTTVTGIPGGSQCTVTEGAMPAAPSGFIWGVPIYTPAGGTVTLTDKGAEVSVKNTLEKNECVRILVSQVMCEVDGSGRPTGAYIWKFRFQNKTGRPISHVYLTDLPAPVAAAPFDSIAFVPPVTNISPLSQITIRGAKPGPLSFTVSFQDQGFECCTLPVRLELPPCDCAQVVSEGTPSCFYPFFVVPPPYLYSFRLQNLSSLPVDHVFVTPVSPLDHITPIASSALTVNKSVHPIPTLPPGGTMATPITVSLSGTEAVGGKNVCLSLTLRSTDPDNCCCSIVRCFTLPDCTFHPPDVRPIGNSRYTPIGTGFVLDNLGSTGGDGITVSLGDARAAELAWLPLDAGAPLPDGAYFELRAIGDQTEGAIRVTKAGKDYRIAPSDLGRHAYKAEVFQKGSVVESVDTRDINVIVIWPVAAGAEVVTDENGNALAFTLGSGKPVPWRITDSVTITGDRLRLTRIDRPSEAMSLHTLELRAANIPRIEVTGTSVFRDCNANGVPDAEDIATGTSTDSNGDGRPDECEGITEVLESLNTGFDEVARTVLPLGERPDGTDDDAWRVVAPGEDRPAKIAIDTIWPSTLADTRWISTDIDANKTAKATNLVFQRCFCLAESADAVKLELQMRADNRATLYLNGRHIAGPGGAFDDSSPLHILLSGRVGDGMFSAGKNCLTIDVEDHGVVGGLDLAGTVTAPRGACPR